jgi:outer membrane protein
MKISSVLLTMLAICLGPHAVAQVQPGAGPMRFTLNEAKNFALNNSPVLLNSARDVEIAKKKIWETTATGLPQANLSSSYNYSPTLSGLTQIFSGGDTTGSGGGSPFGFTINPKDMKTSFNMDIQVSQLIFSGQYIVGLQASKAYSGLSKLAISKSKIDLAESISNVYFEVLVFSATKKVLDSTLAVVEKTRYETEQGYKNGFKESTDVDQLKIQSLNIKSSLSTMERQIEFTERVLKFQMGLPIDQPIVLTDNIEVLVQIMQLEAAIIDSLKIEDNIDYQMASTQEKLMKLSMRAKMAQFLPTIAGFYNRHEDFDNNFFNDQSPNMLGLSLSLPLWSSGQRISQVGQSRLEYLKAQTNKEMLSESLLIQYETVLAGFLSARDIYIMQKETRDLSLRVYLKSITKFREGIGSSLEMNEAQRQYFTAEGSYYGALMTLVSTKANLENLLAKTNSY